MYLVCDPHPHREPRIKKNMTVTSWKSAALAAFMGSAASAQRLVFVPLSSPPADVTHECRADPVCGDDAAAARSLAVPSLTSSPSLLERDMDALFANLFAAPERKYEEDPFDTLFNTMLGTALRAYDCKEQDLPIATLGVEDGEQVLGGEKEKEATGETPRFVEVGEEQVGEEDEKQEDGDAEDSYASSSADYLEAAATPEEAAENALDVMVASLARSGALAVKGEAQKEVGEEAADATSASEWLPEVFSRLESFARTHARRRLSEEGPAARRGVRERLARRLSEYSSNMFLSPDGTVTVYTTHHVTPLSSFHSSASFSSFPSSPPFETRASSPAFLGTGSRRMDACLRARFDAGELAGGCGRAVGELLLARADRSPPGVPAVRIRVRDVEMAPHTSCTFVVHALALFFLVMGCVVLGGACFRQEEDDEEEEDAEVEGFDFVALPEDEDKGEVADTTIFGK